MFISKIQENKQATAIGERRYERLHRFYWTYSRAAKSKNPNRRLGEKVPEVPLL